VGAIRLTRDHGPEVALPEFTLLFTPEGYALHMGARSVPVPGAYSGHFPRGAFGRLVTDLVDRGLWQALRTSAFCAGSREERQLAAPVYAMTEEVRWVPRTPGPALVPSF
jgi:hypothetical protein